MQRNDYQITCCIRLWQLYTNVKKVTFQDNIIGKFFLIMVFFTMQCHDKEGGKIKGSGYSVQRRLGFN